MGKTIQEPLLPISAYSLHNHKFRDTRPYLRVNPRTFESPSQAKKTYLLKGDNSPLVWCGSFVKLPEPYPQSYPLDSPIRQMYQERVVNVVRGNNDVMDSLNKSQTVLSATPTYSPTNLRGRNEFSNSSPNLNSLSKMNKTISFSPLRKTWLKGVTTERGSVPEWPAGSDFTSKEQGTPKWEDFSPTNKKSNM